MIGAILVLVLAVAGWAWIFVPPQPGIWRRTWVVAGVLVAACVTDLVARDELRVAVGSFSLVAVGIGIAVGIGWLALTHVGHAVLQWIVPSMVAQVRDLYAIAAGDSRRDIAVAIVALGTAEEFVFRLVVQREFGIPLAVVAYALVQLVERNWALVLAGAACGAVWGVLYAWQDNLTAPLIAHLIWTASLTFVVPLRGPGNTMLPEADQIAITTPDT
ncbi:MAG: CPBP family glutamic-type intramembrane protease [Ilumatobacteraceae bacterium]